MAQLTISILQAKNLAKVYASTFCIIKVFADSLNKKPIGKWNTKAAKKSSSPVWNYEITNEFKITPNSALIVSLWNKGITGRMIIEKLAAEEWHSLKSRANKSDKVTGEILVGFEYSDDDLAKKAALSAQIAKDKTHREELNLEQVQTQFDMLDKLVFDELFITYRASLVDKEMVWLPRKVVKIDKENQTVTCLANDKEIVISASNMRLGLTMNYLRVGDKVLIKPAKKVVQNIQGLGEMTTKNEKGFYYLSQIERYNESGQFCVVYLEDEYKAKQTFNNIMEVDCRLFIEPKQLIKNIFMAAKDNDLECVKQLIEENGGLINSTNPVAPNYSPLAEAVLKHAVDVVKYLLEQGADPKRNFDAPKKNSTLLHIATYSKPSISENQSKAIELLVKATVNIDAQDDDGNTALHLAYVTKQSQAIKTLLELGANATIKNVSGWVPDMERQKMEYQHAKDSIWQSLSNVKQAALFISENASKYDFKVLLNPNRIVDWPILPLAESLIQNHKDTAKLLLDHGASSDEALLVLCQQCHLESIKTLFEISPTTNVNYHNNTPIETVSPLSSVLKASSYSIQDHSLSPEQVVDCKRKIVSLLLTRGANPTLPCGSARNAYEVVRQMLISEYTHLIDLFKTTEYAHLVKPRLEEKKVPLQKPIIINDVKTQVLELSQFLPENLKIPEFTPQTSENNESEGKCGRVSATVSNAFLSSRRSKLDFICKTIEIHHVLYFYSIAFELHQSEDKCEVQCISMANAPTWEYGNNVIDELQKVTLVVEWRELDSLSNTHKRFKQPIEVTADLTTMSFGKPICVDPSFNVGPLKITLHSTK